MRSMVVEMAMTRMRRTWGDIGRYREISGDTGRSREMAVTRMRRTACRMTCVMGEERYREI